MKFIVIIIALNLLTFASYSQLLQPNVIKYSEGTYILKKVTNLENNKKPEIVFTSRVIQKTLLRRNIFFFVDGKDTKIDTFNNSSTQLEIGIHTFYSIYKNSNSNSNLIFPPHKFNFKKGHKYEFIFYYGYYTDSSILTQKPVKIKKSNKNAGTYFIGAPRNYGMGYAYDATANTGKSAVSIKLYDLETKKLIENGTVSIDGKNYILKDSTLYKGADGGLLDYIYFYTDLDEGESKIQIKNVTGYHNFKIGKMYFRKNWVYEFSIYLVRKKQD